MQQTAAKLQSPFVLLSQSGRRASHQMRTVSLELLRIKRRIAMPEDLVVSTDTETLKTAGRIIVPVLRADKKTIQEKAKALGLSTADYMRRLGLGFEPPSTIDFHAVTELAKINGDQGRLGGLLKLWLTDDAKFRDFANPQSVRGSVLTLLQQIGESQKALQAVMKRIALGPTPK